MAKKTNPCLEDSINIFQDAMQRASLSNYLHVNRTLLSKNNNDNSVIINIDPILWNSIIELPEFKDNIKELDITKAEDSSLIELCSYCDSSSDSWVELNSDELYAGKILKISIQNLEYELTISKALIPLKLKKAEFNNISYRIIPDKMILALKKRFEYPLEEYGFDIIRIFQIV